ncbi:MAG: ribose-5-phosphate isomerase RpiA [Chlamydiota bacterium]
MNWVIKAKKAVGEKAAELVEDGMLVGLGTGSTATAFIESLIKRCQKGLRIEAVATSRRSQQQALNGGIPVFDINRVSTLDICFDGADEIDPKKRMIKGGGGALLREKIVAAMSHEMVVIIDETKCVKELGKFPLPIEIIPFGYRSVIDKLEKLGYNGKVRMESGNYKYVTDSGHFIYDAQLAPKHPKPEQIQEEILHIPGVVETGFFFGLAGRVIVGKSDGSVEIIP